MGEPRRDGSRSRSNRSRSNSRFRRSEDRSRGRRLPSHRKARSSSENPRGKDAFGRTVAGRGKTSDSASSPGRKKQSKKRRKRRNESRSGSADSAAGAAMGAFPPMFPGMPFPMPHGAPGMPGFPFPPMWGWPGMPPPDGPGRGNDRRSGSKSRRRPRGRRRSNSRSRSRSRSRGYGDSNDSVLIRRNIMGRVIGKGGSIINNIRHESGARIDAEDRDEDHCEFRISGTEAEVQRAKTMILEQADRAANPDRSASSSAVGGYDNITAEDASETMEFSINLIGGIIGARGVKINEVRQNSGAKVQVEKSEDKCKVLIAGTEEQVERARAMVRSLADEATALAAPVGSGDAGSSGGGSERMEFPLAAAGRIIGSRGAQISEVRRGSGAQVKVEKLEDCCMVYLSGTPEQVDRAKDMVIGLAEENQVPGGRRAESEETIEIPQNMVGRVIGRGGETIQRLQRDSGAKIDVNNQLDPSPVRLSGSREAVHRAAWMIRDVMDRQAQQQHHAGAPAWGSVPGYPAPGYPADPWGMWAHGAASGYPPSGAGWDVPAGDGGGGYLTNGKAEEIDLDEL